MGKGKSIRQVIDALYRKTKEKSQPPQIDVELTHRWPIRRQTKFQQSPNDKIIKNGITKLTYAFCADFKQ
ncbi:MAG: hypothetical protein ACKO0V_05355 [bacterium]